MAALPNNFESNITIQLARVFTEQFESLRVLSKNVDTQLLTDKFDPTTGDTTFFKRPTDYQTIRSDDGDITGIAPSEIITGKVAGIVQRYFTTSVNFNEAVEALEADQLGKNTLATDTLLGPMVTRMVTDLELDFAAFMLKNTALIAGTFGTAVTNFAGIAEAKATMLSHGIPTDNQWTYVINPFTEIALADFTRQTQAGGAAGKLIKTAHEKATLTENFGGMHVMASTALASFTTEAATRTGNIIGTPDITYVGAKDTMTQTILVDDLIDGQKFKAGEVIEIPSVKRLNLSTRKIILNANGLALNWTGTIVEDAEVGASPNATSEVSLKITGPAIFETAPGTGAYNTVNASIAGQIINFLGATATTFQPNLFWHKQAFSIGSVPIIKLQSTDTLATTKDGFQFRVSYGTNFDANRQKVRIDFRPAYAVLNPFFAGQGWG